MQRIKIKPLSVNDAWKGRRFKTGDYKDYEDDMAYLLPKRYLIPKEGKLFAFYRFGVSNKLADNDNPVKPLQDILQKMYDFNDNRIFVTLIEKELVPVGSEYLEFEIGPNLCTITDNLGKK